MFKGNSNFPLSAPGVPGEYRPTDIDSGQRYSVSSVHGHSAHPLANQLCVVEQAHVLTARESALSPGLGEQHACSVYTSATCNSDSQRDPYEVEEVGESSLSDYESVGTVDEAFALLSAYLDDEVTEDERCLVQHWLASDPEMKSHHQKQLKLRQAFKLFMSDAL